MSSTIKTLATASALALMLHAPAVADVVRTSAMLTHPSQGPEETVQGAEARMVVTETGVLVTLATEALQPGHVHTLWFVAIGAPDACATLPCTGKDVLKNTEAVKADAGYAGGAVADQTGRIAFTHFQPNGPLINGWFGRGLQNIDTSEIHLVIKDHGPALEGRLGAMLTTFRDGCATESINPAFPAVAFADGAEGPNTCALVQHTAFPALDAAAELGGN